MKKVTLLLPDKVMHIIGDSRHAHRSMEELTAEKLIDMLCLADYHETYKMKREEVRVLSIEDQAG
jgi:hypothetical protein